MDERLNPGNSKQLAGGITMANWFCSPSAKKKWKNICAFFKLRVRFKDIWGWFLWDLGGGGGNESSQWLLESSLSSKDYFKTKPLATLLIACLQYYRPKYLNNNACISHSNDVQRQTEPHRAPCRKEKKSLKKIVLPQRKKVNLNM